MGAGRAKASAPIASTSKVAPKKPTAKPSNPYANYSTAESLGYTDPDAERIAAELDARRSQGVAGEWQVIASPQPPAGPEPGKSEPSDALETAEARVKREAEAPPDEEDARAFKLRKKTLNTGLGEIYDPGLIPIKIKKKEEPIEPKLESLDSTSGALANSQASTTGALKWTSLQWKRPGDPSQSVRDAPELTTTSLNVKTEVPTSTGAENASSTSTKWAKPQWSEPLPDLQQDAREKIFEKIEQPEDGSSTDSKVDVKLELDVKTEERQPPPQLSEVPPVSGLFKKRKAPTGAGRGRRQI